MCVVSMIIDHTRHWNPPILPVPYIPWPSPLPSVPARKWTIEEMREFLRLIEEAKKVDAKAGLKDCEDPEKAKLLIAIKQSIEFIEGKNHG